MFVFVQKLKEIWQYRDLIYAFVTRDLKVRYRGLGFLSILFALLFLLPRRAHAYLDPGTGSYIIQVVIATLLGGAYLIKVYWRKIKDFFTGLFSKFMKKESDEKRK